MINKNTKIYIAGHCGLAGSAIKSKLEQEGFLNLVYKTHKELDLTDSNAVNIFLAKEKPEYIILAAAKVGGIVGNLKSPVEFLTENIKIQTNIIENAFKNNINELIFLGSSCIYPKNSQLPIKEEQLLSGSLETTNEAYALAKICGIKLCSYYNKQYGTNYLSVMPCNLYGKNDNYHQENAHVIPMLIRRFHEAKTQNKKEVTVWGTGLPKREFLYADDFAEAIVKLIQTENIEDEIINIGTNNEITIATLAETIKKTVGYEGNIIYDKTKPDGTFSKKLNTEKMEAIGWSATTSLEDGLKITYQDFLTNDNLRK
ncbi:GDP-L-fucose synthase [bacterium]|nr:GDP-L-fucose synthase [bacterium]